MFLVDANDVNAALAPDHFAVFANAFDAGANFHGGHLLLSWRKAIEYRGLEGMLASGVNEPTA
jgi:hypothetical protein